VDLLIGRAGAFLGAVSAAGLAWGWFEAGWVRLEACQVQVPGLPPELDGLRIAHLSDFHLGPPSRGARAAERAVEWVAERRPDLTLITGDLLTRPRGEPLLRRLVAHLPNCYAILGNHDFAVSRDPFSKQATVRDLGSATLLQDEGVVVELRGRRVWVAGADPRPEISRRRHRRLETLSRDDADFRILLCHYPHAVRRLEPGAFELVLAGHMHDGQISLPFPGGKIRLAHPTARYVHGVYRHPAAVLHVSAGLGTTFVPFRFASRPEATELILRAPLP
jgi:predicted MPP superfamily phosphohydrolase